MNYFERLKARIDKLEYLDQMKAYCEDSWSWSNNVYEFDAIKLVLGKKAPNVGTWSYATFRNVSIPLSIEEFDELEKIVSAKYDILKKKHDLAALEDL